MQTLLKSCNFVFAKLSIHTSKYLPFASCLQLSQKKQFCILKCCDNNKVLIQNKIKIANTIWMDTLYGCSCAIVANYISAKQNFAKDGRKFIFKK